MHTNQQRLPCTKYRKKQRKAPVCSRRQNDDGLHNRYWYDNRVPLDHGFIGYAIRWYTYLQMCQSWEEASANNRYARFVFASINAFNDTPLTLFH